VADDYFHQLMLRPEPGVAGLAHRPFDLFRFASGDASAARQLMDEGVFAWWTDPRAVLAFFRPISSFTHWLDYRLWPDSPAWMHAHSLAWFALLLVAVAAVYRRLADSSAAAGLALLFFALDDAHAPVVSWIANRNQVIALALALPALIAHHRARTEGWRTGAWLGPTLFALGLLASEAALVVAAYLTAHAVVFEQRSYLRRFLPLLPYAAVVVLWRGAYQLLGYGAVNSGLYVDPLRAPGAFLAAVVERLPVLALAQLAGPWADLWEVYPFTFPALRYAVGALACLVIAGFAALSYPHLKESRVARFFGLGALLALVPVCASFPHDRLLLGSGIGAMGLIAGVICHALRERGATRSRLALASLVPLHLLLAPVLLPLRAAGVNDFNRVLAAGDRSIPSSPDIAGKCVVLVNPPLDPFAAYLPVYRQARWQARPRHLLWLNSGVTELAITGAGSNSLRIRAKDGFLSSSTQLMLRDPKRRLKHGETIDLSTATIQVAASTEDGRPLEIVVHFREALRSERLLFLEWRQHGYVPFVPPREGESVTVPALDLVRTLFG
jgi:hypothetical protein